MHQRIAMDAFERGRGGQRLVLFDAKQARRLDKKKRPEALAAAKRGIAHRLAEPRAFGLGARVGEKAVEASLDGAGHAFESFEKGHGKGVGPAALCRKGIGYRYPNTTLLEAATRRYKAKSWRFKRSQASARGSAA